MSLSTLTSFERHMQTLGKRPGTIARYGGVMLRFLTQVGKPAEQIGPDDVYAYLVDRGTSQLGPSSYNVQYWALVLWMESRGIPRHLRGLVPKRVPVPLPRWLSDIEVVRLLEAVEQRHFRMLFQVMVATGMRLGEVLALRGDHIECQTHLIRVPCGKGGKGRFVLLTDTLLERLRDYWRTYRPPELLFTRRPGSDLRPMLASTVNAALQRAAKKAGFSEAVTSHRLRHTFAIHSLRRGRDIVTLQHLLGHQNITTTARYLTPDLPREHKIIDLLDAWGVAP